MLGVRSLALLSLAAFASAQSLPGIDDCGNVCYRNVVNNAGSFNCAAMDFNCLCRVDSYLAGIRDCASNACPPGYMPTVTNAVAAQCATATGGAVPTSSSTTPAAPTTTTPPTSTSVSSSQALSSTSSSTGTTLATSTTSSTSASSTTSSTSHPTKAATTSTSSSTSAAAATTSTSATADPNQSGGLTEAAKIGVGVGVAAAVIALLAIGACLVLRKRRAISSAPSGRIDRFKISHPMPSDEHAYTRDNNSDYDIGDSGDLEMKSRRYEDMVPRVQPRQMVWFRHSRPGGDSGQEQEQRGGPSVTRKWKWKWFFFRFIVIFVSLRIIRAVRQAREKP